MPIKTYTIGGRTFELDMDKAQAALDSKRVLNGADTPFFNIIPLRYPWAYDMYKKMKANHWEPEDVRMQKDVEQWRDTSGAITDIDRWIVRMAVGYFSAAEGIVGDNIQHVTRDIVTASELKLLLGRHAHEENIHADSLIYMLSSLGLNAHECEAMLDGIPSIRAKTEFVVKNSRHLRRGLDMTLLENKQAFVKNCFLFGQCMEGTQFYGLFGMLLALGRQGKFPGISQMFRYTIRDECLVGGTQVLTSDGWIDIETWTGQHVAQYEKSGNISFVAPLDASKSLAPYTWHFTSKQGHVNLKVSPNHRMVMRTLVSKTTEGKRESRLKIEIAEKCQHNPYSAHICAGNLLNKKASSTLTPLQQFLIAFQADGNASNIDLRDGSRVGYTWIKFNLTRACKIKRLREICTACGFKLKEGGARANGFLFEVQVPPHIRLLKHFRSWVNLGEVNSEWASEFIGEATLWDGHKVKAKTRRITWTNKNKDDVDIVQTLAALTGYRTLITKVTDTRFKEPATYYRLHICCEQDYFRGNQITKTKTPGEMVYGLQVPSGMLMVRYNNTIAVTGNCNHIEVFRNIIMDCVSENQEVWTPAFKEELRDTMREAIQLEKAFINDCLPMSSVGLSKEEFCQYIDFIGDRRLNDVGLVPLNATTSNPFPWLAEMMDIKKEQNFFEGTVTEYQKASSLTQIPDDDL